MTDETRQPRGAPRRPAGQRPTARRPLPNGGGAAAGVRGGQAGVRGNGGGVHGSGQPNGTGGAGGGRVNGDRGDGGRRRRAGLNVRHAQMRRSRRRLALRVTLLVIALVSALSLAGVATVYGVYQSYRSQLPDATQLGAMEPPQDSFAYDRQGNLIAVFRSDERHTHAALAQVSRWARLATIDVEDRNFYGEGSWDLKRIVKAGYEDVRHQSNTQGASTITQQLAKISFLGYGAQRSITYKAKQVLLGIEIENNFSKDQILEMYLNRIEYGNHSVGIETAAQTFFHKSARDLDLAEAAMLAGLPNSPVALYPLNHGPAEDVNPLAKQRQRTVLSAMVTQGDVTRTQADAALAEKLTFHSWQDSLPPRSAFTDYVEQWLRQHFGGAYLDPGGWRIETTLDPPTQALAQQSLSKGVAAAKTNNVNDGALVSMDPKSGEVLGMAGAANPDDPDVGQFNMATTRLQPGSTIKLFTYTAAILSRQFTMNTPIVDAPVTYHLGPGDDFAPKNYDRRFHGTCALHSCLGNSFNVPAVKTEVQLGVPFITDLEIAAGLTSLAAPDNRPGPLSYAATLGGLTYGVTPLELADGVATIADLGVHHEATPVKRILAQGSGAVLYTHDAEKEGKRVVPSGVAFIMSEMTSNDSNRVQEFGAHGLLTLPDRRVSAKTGTTEDFLSNWTVGWTPDIVSVVMVGNPYHTCLSPADAAKVPSGYQHDRDGHLTPADVARFHLTPYKDACGPLDGIKSGITGAAPIWNDFMVHATAGLPKTSWYQKPPDVLSEGGGGDDGYFYLPGTALGTGEGHCWYYGPAPEPSNPCTYIGAGPPAQTPHPGPAPGPTPGYPAGGPPPPVAPASPGVGPPPPA